MRGGLESLTILVNETVIDAIIGLYSNSSFSNGSVHFLNRQRKLQENDGEVEMTLLKM